MLKPEDNHYILIISKRITILFGFFYTVECPSTELIDMFKYGYQYVGGWVGVCVGGGQ